ncbi:hypothetical protein C8R47DRAFT_1211128 [Mycena vitilis]|nr:hypothetical protein C8R47DRAFT_1211128 [Mycena vitilis]
MSAQVQDQPLPSISLVLSQNAQSAPASYIVFPWTSVRYQAPVLPAPANTNSVPTLPQTSVAQTPTNSLTNIIMAVRRFFALIVTRLKTGSIS